MNDFLPSQFRLFKAYDIRGELGKNLDEDIAYRIGRAFAQFLKVHRYQISKTSDCDWLWLSAQ